MSRKLKEAVYLIGAGVCATLAFAAMVIVGADWITTSAWVTVGLVIACPMLVSMALGMLIRWDDLTGGHKPTPMPREHARPTGRQRHDIIWYEFRD